MGPYGVMLLLKFPCVCLCALVCHPNGPMILICFAFKYALKKKGCGDKILQEHVYQLALSSRTILIIPTHLMELEGAWKHAHKGHFQIIKIESAGIIQIIVLMGGVMIITIVVLIYVLDLIPGILMAIMKHIYVPLDAVRVHGLIAIQAQEFVLLFAQEATIMLEHQIQAALIVLVIIIHKDVSSTVSPQIHGQTGRLIDVKVAVQVMILRIFQHIHKIPMEDV